MQESMGVCEMKSYQWQRHTLIDSNNSDMELDWV